MDGEDGGVENVEMVYFLGGGLRDSEAECFLLNFLCQLFSLVGCEFFRVVECGYGGLKDDCRCKDGACEASSSGFVASGFELA